MPAKRWLVRLGGQQLSDVGTQPVCGACERRHGHRDSQNLGRAVSMTWRVRCGTGA